MGRGLLADGTESEDSLQQWLHERAKLAGWDTQYHTFNSEHSDDGFPDWFAIRELPGVTYRANSPVYRYVVAELKSQRGLIRAQQARWLDRLAVIPHLVVCLWRPSDRDEIERILTSNEPYLTTPTHWMARRDAERRAKDRPPTRRRRAA